MNELPFEEEQIGDNIFIRNFYPDVLDEELKWHIDDEDRIVEPMNENDWQFQFDDSLPQKITDTIVIKKGVWHRLIKGSTDLSLKVTKIK